MSTLESFVKEYQNDKAILLSEIAVIKKALESKVSYKQYNWSLGIMIMITMAMFGYIALRMDTFGINQVATQEKVAFIYGKFENISSVEIKP